MFYLHEINRILTTGNGALMMGLFYLDDELALPVSINLKILGSLFPAVKSKEHWQYCLMDSLGNVVVHGAPPGRFDLNDAIFCYILDMALADYGALNSCWLKKIKADLLTINKHFIYFKRAGCRSLN